MERRSRTAQRGRRCGLSLNPSGTRTFSALHSTNTARGSRNEHSSPQNHQMPGSRSNGLNELRQFYENKKQCSRQLQCEVPCSIGNIVNSSLFINSSLSSLSSTSYAVCKGGPQGRGVWLQGRAGHGGRCSTGGQGTFWSSCHILHYHVVLRPKGTSHNNIFRVQRLGLVERICVTTTQRSRSTLAPGTVPVQCAGRVVPSIAQRKI